MSDLAALDCAPELAAVADALRRIIFDSVPGVEERIYKGRSSAGYHDRQFGAFCGLFVGRRAVRLEFPRAAVARVLHGALVAGL